MRDAVLLLFIQWAVTPSLCIRLSSRTRCRIEIRASNARPAQRRRCPSLGTARLASKTLGKQCHDDDQTARQGESSAVIAIACTYKEILVRGQHTKEKNTRSTLARTGVYNSNPAKKAKRKKNQNEIHRPDA